MTKGYKGTNLVGHHVIHRLPSLGHGSVGMGVTVAADIGGITATATTLGDNVCGNPITTAANLTGIRPRASHVAVASVQLFAVCCEVRVLAAPALFGHPRKRSQALQATWGRQDDEQ